MNTRARIEAFTARLLMAVFLVVGLVPRGEHVFCFDAGRALTLESSGESGSCSDCTGAPCSTSSFGVTSEPDCACTDFAVQRPDDRDRVVTTDHVSIDAPAIALTIPAALPPADFRPIRTCLERPRPPDALGVVRTVVLLI